MLKYVIFMIIVIAAFLPVCACAAEAEERLRKKQDVIRAGSYDSVEGPSDIFTGRVRIDNIFPEKEPARSSGAYVTFEPGARSNWHTHTVGQTLIVTSGVGLTGTWDGEVVKLYPGDVVQCPPGVKHWHGAAPGTAMTHISICESCDGDVATWMEKVTDEQYAGK